MIALSSHSRVHLTQRAGTALLLGLSLLAGPACTSGSAGESPSIELRFDSQRAWADLEAQVALGPRPSGSDANEKTRLYIEAELRAIGLEPVREAFTDQTPAGELAFCNLYADLQGHGSAEKPAHILLIATHFDTKNLQGEHFLGANDGGSSTACVLELARAMVAGGARELTYRFLFLDGEEAVREYWAGNDNTYGSRYHAKMLMRRPEYDLVKACVLLDMIGDKHLRIWRDSNSSRPLYDMLLASAAERGLAKYMSGAESAVKDDHLSFMKVDIPSVDLIDLDYGPDSQSNDWWHTAEDTLDKCSPESLRITGEIVLGALPKFEKKFARKK